MNKHTSMRRCRLKYVATINDDLLNGDTDDNYELRYVDIGSVSCSGSVQNPVIYRFKDAPCRARRRVQDGDIIISCVRTHVRTITQIRNPPDNLVVSTGFAVVRPSTPVFDPRFANYALKERSFLAEIEKRSVGASYPAIKTSELADISVYFPSLVQQRNFADYLDRRMAELDELIVAEERALSLLAEKRQALVAQAITKGVDRHVTIRCTGIPWLGEIPARWKLGRLKELRKPSGGDSTILSKWASYWTENLDVTALVGSGSVSKLGEKDRAQLPITVPPEAEQRAVTAYLDRKLEELDMAKTAIDRNIALLEERRSSLIEAVVAGQIAVKCAA